MILESSSLGNWLEPVTVACQMYPVNQGMNGENISVLQGFSQVNNPEYSFFYLGEGFWVRVELPCHF